MFRLSLRSWLFLTVPVVALLVIAAMLSSPSSRSRGDTPALPPLPATPLPDAALPGGATAQLSKCRVDDGPRPRAVGEGEKDALPQLTYGGYGAEDPGPGRGRPHFTVHMAVAVGDRPLLLGAPVSAGRVTLDVFGPHGEGRRASVRGLTATVVTDDFPSEAVPPPPGGFRIAPGRTLSLDVELPAAALCPGYTLFTVGACSPERTNDAQDCPVLTLTLSDPAVRDYRAAVTGRDPASMSDRLVAVSLEPEISGA